MMLKKALTTIERLEAFSAFLESGIEHLTKHGLEGKLGTSERSKVVLPTSSVEKMKDIRYDVKKLTDKLRTGLSGTSIYSTQAEDYLDSGSGGDDSSGS